MDTIPAEHLTRMQKAAHYISQCGFNSYTQNTSDIQHAYVECIRSGQSPEKAIATAVASCAGNRKAPELVQVAVSAIAAPKSKNIADGFIVLGVVAAFAIGIAIASGITVFCVQTFLIK